jgi:hypothetical protein
VASFKRLLLSVLAAFVIFGVLYFVIGNYGYVFSVTVDGEIVGVERVAPPVAILNNSQGVNGAPGMFSFAVAIRDAKGIIHTASSEDRQWAVAKAGNCVTATFYPYAPWNLKKEGTYYNARLDQLRDCKAAGTAGAVSGAEPTVGNGQTAPSETAAPAVPEATPAQ